MRQEGNREGQNTTQTIVLSIVVPLYNEEGNIVPLVQKLREVVASLRVSYEQSRWYLRPNQRGRKPGHAMQHGQRIESRLVIRNPFIDRVVYQ